ncbi:S-adenosyl-L-methionine-dependent methyltransferase [Microdochium bolleyi]|uniref:protein-L-isoaspartate(D-aspartate) O-methyltransferase n=1 Tax=Microdochium bolleyi TaxID=196109 RepID=A0A136IWJ3_9PEZI|nr:S-adenosyl-L-methionine-dependent methyltransferase [Microdochium bolleyi]
MRNPWAVTRHAWRCENKHVGNLHETTVRGDTCAHITQSPPTCTPFRAPVAARNYAISSVPATGLPTPSSPRFTFVDPSRHSAQGRSVPSRTVAHYNNTSSDTHHASKMHGAWRSSGATNADLVENLWRNGMLKSPVVKDAFMRVDRAQYCPSAATAHQDRPQSIGHGATISAPHMHANAVESLLAWVLPVNSDGSGTGGAREGADFKLAGVPGRPRRVLDIGSGSGYLTHILAELVGPEGVVVGVEHIRELRELGEGNMRKSAEGRALLDSGRVRFRVGDGRKGWAEPARRRTGSTTTVVKDGTPGNDGGAAAGSEGGVMPGVGGAAPPPAPPLASSSDDGQQQQTSEGKEEEEGGWDAIHVGAAAVTLHDALLQQLRSPGRLFIPVEDEGSGDQYIWTVDKDEKGVITKRKLYGVRYVPLTDAPGR